jgi:hypothetical protein
MDKHAEYCERMRKLEKELLRSLEPKTQEDVDREEREKRSSLPPWLRS